MSEELVKDTNSKTDRFWFEGRCSSRSRGAVESWSLAYQDSSAWPCHGSDGPGSPSSPAWPCHGWDLPCWLPARHHRHHIHAEYKAWHKWTWLLNRVTDTQNQLAVAKQEGLGLAGMSFHVQDGETGPHFICLYTENIQCPRINHKGKEYFF